MKCSDRVFWNAVAGIFGVLFFYHVVVSVAVIPPFPGPERPVVSGIRTDIEINGSPLDKPLADFVAKFNEYIEGQNSRNMMANIFAAIGYAVAAFTALASAQRAGVAEGAPRKTNDVA